MLQPFDAELLVFRADRGLVGAFERDEGREIGALAGQFLGELEAGARRGRVGIDGVVENAEAVLVAQLLVALAHLRDFAQVERKAVGIERRTPQLAVREGAAEQHQRVGLLAGIAGALIRDVGGGRGALEEIRALAVVGRADLQDGARQAQPVAGFARRDRDDLRQRLHPGAEIALARRRLRPRCASVATGFATCPDSVLIWVSSRTALSARSDLWKGLSAAVAEKENEQHQRGSKASADTGEHRRTSLTPKTGPCFPST